jgi:predicted ABC-type ATPase
MAEKPLLFVIAGSNGSGKTTFVEKINPDILLKTKFVNADIIAKNLKEKFPDKKEGHLNLMAGKEALKLYEKYISEKRSFSMETTLSGNSPIQFLKRAKEIGFETSLTQKFELKKECLKADTTYLTKILFADMDEV